MTNKTYHIKSIDDITKVVDENNVDALVKDFASFLRVHIAAKEINKAAGQEVARTGRVFIWIDDGKNEVKINLTIKQK